MNATTRMLTILSLTLWGGLTSVATATPTIVVGDYSPVLYNTAKTLPINITGGDALTGVVFIFEISQGGIFPSFGSPTIASIDLTSPGTVFASNHQPPAVQFSNRSTNTTVTNVAAVGGPNVWTPSSGTPIKVKESFLTQSGTVTGSGLLGTIVIDTFGAGPGWYDLKITAMVTAGGGGNTTSFPGFASSLTNGDIFVEPEPSSLALSLFALASLAALAIRTRRVH